MRDRPSKAGAGLVARPGRVPVEPVKPRRCTRKQIQSSRRAPTPRSSVSSGCRSSRGPAGASASSQAVEDLRSPLRHRRGPSPSGGGSSWSPATCSASAWRVRPSASYQIASALSREHDVTLVSLGRADLEPSELRDRLRPSDDLQRFVDWCDGHLPGPLSRHPHGWLEASTEGRSWSTSTTHSTSSSSRSAVFDRRPQPPIVHSTVEVLNQQIGAATSSCAPARSSGTSGWASSRPSTGSTRTSTTTTSRCGRCSPWCRSALPTTPPERTGPGIRGVVAGIRTTTRCSLGRWHLQLVRSLHAHRAVDRLLGIGCPTVRLFFMGTKHPNPDVPEMRVAVEAVETRRGARVARPLRLLQRRLGALRRAPELPARRRHRRQRPTSSTSRRRSRSAPGSSTTSGPNCPSSAPRGMHCPAVVRGARTRPDGAARGRRGTGRRAPRAADRR